MNSIEFAEKFLPIIDEVYKAGAVTEGLDAATRLDFTGVNEVKALKISTTGLGDYDRENGYPQGDVTAAWETFTLTQERGKEISVDRMDDEETLGMVFGQVVGSFMREHVIPEIDAYRFAKYASTDGVTTVSETLTADTLQAAIDEAVRTLDEYEVPFESRLLCVNSNLRPIINAAFARYWSNDTKLITTVDNYNGIKLLYVPPTRFYTGITMNDGSSDWGFTAGAGASAINFMLLDRRAVLQAKKFMMPKIFSPDVNQDKDAWKFQFRLYHDALVYENKVKGIYVNTAE